MCGRYELNITPGRMEKLFNLGHPPGDIPARYNVAPSQVLPIVRLDRAGERELATMKWGLIPFWAKAPKIAYKTINARAETVATSPALRDAFKSKHCLVPVSGFYEWKKVGVGKQPYHIDMQDGEPFAFAALWSWWKPPEGDAVDTYTIIMTEPNELCANLHDRMPVILAAEDCERWLDVAAPDPQELLRPYPADEMRTYPVSTRVNSPKNDDDTLIQTVPELAVEPPAPS